MNEIADGNVRELTPDRQPDLENSNNAQEQLITRNNLDGFKLNENDGSGAVTTESSAASTTNTTNTNITADLESRMSKAKLEELGWRGRDDLGTVMRDLERLANDDWKAAAKLWDRYRPNDIDKPVFIDGDDVNEKKPVHVKEVAHDTPHVADRNSDVGNNDFVTPESLRKRFLQAENKFYFRDEENKLAFEDKGKRLATEHNDPDIVRSMVDLAEAKGWNSLKLKGTDEFRREAWLQASLKGMEVNGFQARDVDRAKLADLRHEQSRTADKGLNIIEHAPERVRSNPLRDNSQDIVDEHQGTLSVEQRRAVEALKTILRGRGDSEKAADMAAEVAAERFQNNRVYVGKLLAHGAAPYENDPKNEDNYYLKLQTEMGEKIVWGVDLKRAIDDGKAELGEDVAIAYQGRQKVTVKVKERDPDGKVIGEKDIVTNRNAWDVRKLDAVREEARERLNEAAHKTNLQPLVPDHAFQAQRRPPLPELAHNTQRGQPPSELAH